MADLATFRNLPRRGKNAYLLHWGQHEVPDA
jgi:hypothetical protein